MGFDPNKFKEKVNDYIVIADGDYDIKYSKELEQLRGLTGEQITHFSGNATQLNEIIAELEKAKQTNVSQAQLISNVKSLGKSTYQLARKVSDLIP